MREDDDADASQDAADDMNAPEAPQAPGAAQVQDATPPGDAADAAGEPGSSVAETQDADVRWFIERFRINSGVIELLNQFLIALANRAGKTW